MAFLDDYEGTERIDLGRDYWVEVKKCLTRAERAKAARIMGKVVATDNGHGGKSASVIPDMPGYQDEMLLASIVDWNLDGKDGVLPLTPDRAKRDSIARLPGTVVDRIYQVIDRLNTADDPAEQAGFPDPGDAGDPGGVGGAAEPPAVLTAAGAVETPGDAA